MRRQRISEVIGSIDEKYVEEANSYVAKAKNGRPGWVKWAAIAACLALVVVGIGFLQHISSESAEYKIVYQDGRYIMKFSEEFQNSANTQGSVAVPRINFRSLSDMRDRILNHDLTEIEIYTLARFPKDDKGNTKFFDLTNLYVPILPEGISHGPDFDLVGDCGLVHYETMMLYETNASGVTCWRYYPNEYQELFNDVYNYNFGANHLVSHTQTEERNAEVYEYRTYPYKRIQYTIETEETTLHIFELYNYVEDIIPYEVCILSEVGSDGFYVNFIGLYERPTVEWLSCFGAEPFKE